MLALASILILSKIGHDDWTVYILVIFTLLFGYSKLPFKLYVCLITYQKKIFQTSKTRGKMKFSYYKYYGLVWKKLLAISKSYILGIMVEDISSGLWRIWAREISDGLSTSWNFDICQNLVNSL